MSMIID